MLRVSEEEYERDRKWDEYSQALNNALYHIERVKRCITHASRHTRDYEIEEKLIEVREGAEDLETLLNKLL